MTPGRPPIRPSMDCTQDSQVMPSTPTVTQHRLVLNAIPRLEDEKHLKKTRGNLERDVQNIQMLFTGYTRTFLSHNH